MSNFTDHIVSFDKTLVHVMKPKYCMGISKYMPSSVKAKLSKSVGKVIYIMFFFFHSVV